MHGRLIARVLGVSSGYLTQVMSEIGLAQRHRGATVDEALSRLPGDPQQRVMAFRTMPKSTLAQSALGAVTDVGDVSIRPRSAKTGPSPPFLRA